MALEDSFVGTYFLGKEEDIEKYLGKNEKSGGDFKASFVVEGALALLTLSTPIGLPLAIDAMCRAGYAFFNKDDPGLKDISKSPGIVGIIREYVK